MTFDSDSAQASAVADTIRRARLQGQVGAWSEIAVLVRSANDITALSFALQRAAIPVSSVADAQPMRQQAGAKSLLELVEHALAPARSSAELIEQVLLGPIGGFDPGSLRAMKRHLLSQERARQADSGRPVRTSQQLLRLAALGEIVVDGLPDELRSPLVNISSLTAQVGELISTREPIESILWQIWQASSWPNRLRSAAKRPGAAGRFANRDLDSVVALFAAAARSDEIFDAKRDVADFVDEMRRQVLAMGERGRGRPAPDAVSLLTAHSAKGLEWDFVIVAGVQDQTWPDLRSKPSLLDVDQLTRDTETAHDASFAEQLDDERRLFYVACTRARKRLLITAVHSIDGSVRPSRFLDRVAGARGVRRRHEAGYRQAPLALWALVAELRSVVEDEGASTELRQEARSTPCQAGRRGRQCCESR